LHSVIFDELHLQLIQNYKYHI